MNCMRVWINCIVMGILLFLIDNNEVSKFGVFMLGFLAAGVSDAIYEYYKK